MNDPEYVQTPFDNCGHITSPMYMNHQSLNALSMVIEEGSQDPAPGSKSPAALCAVSLEGQKPFRNKRFRNAWGNLSYAHIISAAILSSPRRKMKLNEIYTWFTNNIPYFSLREDEIKSRGWKNSIRHNLSLKKEFIRESGDKKAGYWYIDQKALLDRLKAENRQITDANYNRDMELFELYVQQAFSGNSPQVEDFIAFSRKHLADTAISGILDGDIAKEFVCFTTTSDNPFYLINTQSQFPSELCSKSHQKTTSFSNTLPVTFHPLAVQDTSRHNEMSMCTSEGLQPDVSSFPGQECSSSTILLPVKSSMNGLAKTPNGMCEFVSNPAATNQTYASANDNLLFLAGPNAYFGEDRVSTAAFMGGQHVENVQNGLSQTFFSHDMSTPGQYVPLTNYGVHFQPLEAFRGIANSPGYLQSLGWNVIDPSQFSRNYGGKVPIIVNGNCLVPDVPLHNFGIDSNQSVIKM